MPTKPTRRSVLPLDPARYAPTPARPLRAKLRRLAAHTRVEPHQHPWAQVAMSDRGVIRMSAGTSTFLVPPMRALWIPPDVEHVVSVVEDADIRTLYVHQDAACLGPMRRADAPAAWQQCRVLEVSPLLRELAAALPHDADPRAGVAQAMDARERSLAMLVLDELSSARPLRLGVALPTEKRLRALCDAVLATPGLHGTLDDFARDAGASPRTLARLFRRELGTSFAQWREQVLLAHALALAARRVPMATIASELGYASASAFSAMVRRSMGVPPSRLLNALTAARACTAGTDRTNNHAPRDAARPPRSANGPRA